MSNNSDTTSLPDLNGGPERRGRKLRKNIEFVRDLARVCISERVLGVEYTQRHGRLAAETLTDPEDIHQARVLATSEFLRLGKIDPSIVGPDGVFITDRLLDTSTFFGVKDRQEDGRMVAAARLVRPDMETGLQGIRLPLEQLPAESQDRVRAYEPGTFAEFGALAKTPGTSKLASMLLIREMLSHSKRNGVTKWVCGLEPKVYPEFKERFLGAITELSDETVEFPGVIGPQVPLEADIDKMYGTYMDDVRHRSMGARAVNRVIVGFMMNGIPDLANTEATK